MDFDGGRTAQFNDASEGVREPQFRLHSAPYRKVSVLDNLLPSGNGMGSFDRQRTLMGIPHSSIGQSNNTFDQSLWLRAQEPASRYENDSE